MFFRPPVDAFADDTVNLEDVWGARGRSLRARLLEERSIGGIFDVVERDLLAMAPDLTPDAMVLAATRALAASARVTAVQESVGMARSTFVRRFTAAVGIPPKQFAMLTRFRRVLASSRSSWAEIAADCGYHDQAHLIRDFRALAGVTPTLYSPRSDGELSHVPL